MVLLLLMSRMLEVYLTKKVGLVKRLAARVILVVVPAAMVIRNRVTVIIACLMHQRRSLGVAVSVVPVILTINLVFNTDILKLLWMNHRKICGIS